MTACVRRIGTITVFVSGVIMVNFVVHLVSFSALISAAVGIPCEEYNSIGTLAYWEDVSNCTACVKTSGCGFCHSTMACMEGTANGPKHDLPCPQWFSEVESCPVKPTCHEHLDCGTCASNTECAWCASKGKCMMVSDIFSESDDNACRGTVFDPPCPSSFVGINRVVGNLIIEKDPVFGGGELHVTGRAYNGKNFELHIDSKEIRALSSEHVNILAGSSDEVGQAGKGVHIS
eukprot:g2907.t1